MLKLRLLTGPRAGRQLRVSDTKPVSVGRRVGRLRLHDSRVSKRHAKIFFTNGTWILRDLGSANGTFINHRRCEGLVELETGDVIQMGRVLIKIVQADAVGMDPMRVVPDVTGTQASRIGIDAFTASGATGMLPAIDPATPAPPKRDADGEIDLASLFGGSDDEEDDLIDFSDQSRADASRAGTVDAGKTQVNDETLEIEPIELDTLTDAEEPGQAKQTYQGATPVDDADELDPLLAGIEREAPVSESPEDLVEISDDIEEAGRFGSTLLAALTEEECDDDKPVIVGLRMDQAAPQQPIAQDESADHDQVDAATAPPEPIAIEDQAVEIAEPEPEVAVAALAEPFVEVPAPIADVQAHRTADECLTEIEPVADSKEPELDLATAHAELALEDITEAGPEPIDPDILAQELWPVEALDQTEYEADVQAEAVAEAASDEPAQAVIQADDQAWIAAERESEDADAPAAADATAADVAAEGFDIDAAFDALSQGLDDSLQLPAITDETASGDAPDEDAIDHAEFDEVRDEHPQGIALTDQADEPAEQPAPIDSPDLAGSQLDVSFIREALARLEQDQNTVADEPADDFVQAASIEASFDDALDASLDSDGSFDAGESSDASGLMVATADTTEPGLDESEFRGLVKPISAPPGLNPTTMLPPSEPSRSYRTSEKRKRGWFFTAIAFIVVFGLGAAIAFLITNNYLQTIAGRSDQDTTTPAPDLPDNEAAPLPPNPRIDKPAQPITPENPYKTPSFDNPVDPGAADNTPGSNEPIAGAAPIPAPFAEGPAVIGKSALIGITKTSGSAGNATLPKPDRPTRPGVVIQPTLPGTDKPINPDLTDPNAGTVTPLEPIDPQPRPEPADLIDKPTRIVFLVDASGSLVDSLPQMLLWLNKAVDTVGADERFAIIFFKAGQAIETDPAGMQAPTRETIAKLESDWLNPDAAPILPAGRSDPSKAIEKALQYNPTDIYLLSDESFARFAGDTTRDEAVKLVVDALGQAKVKIHGVQFFYRDAGGVLETLSNRYSGTFEFVKEDVVPDANPIDLLQELDKSE